MLAFKPNPVSPWDTALHACVVLRQPVFLLFLAGIFSPYFRRFHCSIFANGTDNQRNSLIFITI